MKRKSVKSAPRQAKTRAAQGADTVTASKLPMEIQIDERFTDHDFEWEVVTHPSALHGGKSLRARIQRPGLPETERDMTWPAHVRSQHTAGPMSTTRRVCALCGRVFAILLPPGVQELERDRLCGDCATLPKPPEENRP
jgi:hypothetical protein